MFLRLSQPNPDARKEFLKTIKETVDEYFNGYNYHEYINIHMKNDNQLIEEAYTSIYKEQNSPTFFQKEGYYLYESAPNFFNTTPTPVIVKVIKTPEGTWRMQNFTYMGNDGRDIRDDDWALLKRKATEQEIQEFKQRQEEYAIRMHDMYQQPGYKGD